MRSLELALIVVIVALLYATLSVLTVSPKLSLRNDYFLLSEEAYSVARLLAESDVLPYVETGDQLKVLVGSLVPANREFRVVVWDALHNTTLTAETPHFGDCTLAATGTVLYSDSRTNRIYVVRVSLGRITGG